MSVIEGCGGGGEGGERFPLFKMIKPFLMQMLNV